MNTKYVQTMMKIQPSYPLNPSSGEGSNAVDAATLARMAADPAQAARLKSTQDKIYAAFLTTVEKVVEVLNKHDPLKAVALGRGPMGGSSLAMSARRVSMDTKGRREYAHALLAGAVLNRNNPDWNPADPATDKAQYDDPIVTLMRMGPIGTDTGK